MMTMEGGGLISLMLPFIKQQFRFGRIDYDGKTITVTLSEDDLRKLIAEAMVSNPQFKGLNLAPILAVSIKNNMVVLSIKVV